MIKVSVTTTTKKCQRQQIKDQLKKHNRDEEGRKMEERKTETYLI